MKKLTLMMFAGAFLILAGLFYACTKSGTDTAISANGNEAVVVGKLNNTGRVTFSKSDKQLSELLSRKLPGITNIRNHHVEKWGEQYYWFAKGTDANNVNMSIASELSANEYGDEFELAAGTTHTCTANAGCDGCDFVRDSVSNKIKGCKCVLSQTYVDPSRARCTHSITTSEAMLR